MGGGIVEYRVRGEDGRPLLDAAVGEALCLVQQGAGIAFDDAPIQHPGTLYVTTKRLIWLSDADMLGYAVDFLSLSMHAVSRDTEAYPAPCIYTQIEAVDNIEYEDEDETEMNSQEPRDLSMVQEMRLVPLDASVLDNIFKVLCDCAALNPDPEGELEGEGEWYYNKDEVQGSAIGQSNSVADHNLVDISELQIDDEKFEDADDMEDEDCS